MFDVGDGAPDCDLIVNAVVFGNAPKLIKRGPGTMCLAGVNTYLATTLVEEGILDVNNGLSLGSPVGNLRSGMHDFLQTLLRQALACLHLGRGTLVDWSVALQATQGLDVANHFTARGTWIEHLPDKTLASQAQGE